MLICRRLGRIHGKHYTKKWNTSIYFLSFSAVLFISEYQIVKSGTLTNASRIIWAIMTMAAIKSYIIVKWNGIDSKLGATNTLTTSVSAQRMETYIRWYINY